MAQFLPTDLLQSICTFVASQPADVWSLECVSKSFFRASQICWVSLAQRRYGRELFEKTIHLYEGSAKNQLKDDNRLGASRRLLLNKPCFYRFNRTDYFFCCLVHSVQWDRENGRVKLYLDVHGERDLRPPTSSTLHISTASMPLRGFREIRARLQETSVEGIWKPAKEASSAGHFKGSLEFREADFVSTEGYDFCYANPGFGVPDYKITPVLRPFSGLFDLFSDGKYVSRDSSPFDDDTKSKELERWRRIVPPLVWTRTTSLIGGSPRWWVVSGDA